MSRPPRIRGPVTLRRLGALLVAVLLFGACGSDSEPEATVDEEAQAELNATQWSEQVDALCLDARRSEIRFDSLDLSVMSTTVAESVAAADTALVAIEALDVTHSPDAGSAVLMFDELRFVITDLEEIHQAILLGDEDETRRLFDNFLTKPREELAEYAATLDTPSCDLTQPVEAWVLDEDGGDEGDAETTTEPEPEG